MAEAVKLEPVEEGAIAKQYACALEGVAATWSALQVVEAELKRNQAPEVTPIGVGALRRAQRDLRAVMSRALQLAKAMGVDQAELVRLMPRTGESTVEGDVGAIAADSKLGRIAADMHFGGVTPAASFAAAGGSMASKAIAKLGARRAVAAAAAFGRFGANRVRSALGHVRRGLSAFAKQGGPFADAAAKAVVFFAAAGALRFGLTGGAPLLESPAGIALVALGVFLVLNRRR